MPPRLRTSLRLQTLHAAQSAHEYVHLTRTIDHTEPLTGYIVEVGTDWLVMSVFEAGLADGWLAVEVADVEALEVAPEGRFVRRGLEARHGWPPEAPRPPLSTSEGIHGLLDSAHRSFAVAAIYTERRQPAMFTLGRPVGWTAEGLEWQELARDATWAEDTQLYPASVITRVHVGGRYATALARVADLRGEP